jgi:hypothetical protein
MAIIDVKTKYVWDYYLESKDQVFQKIQERLEKETGFLRRKYPITFVVVLFSDIGEAKSSKVEEACRKYGVKRETTTGYLHTLKGGFVKCRNVEMPDVTVRSRLDELGRLKSYSDIHIQQGTAG